MNASTDLEKARKARNAAQARVAAGIANVKADLAARGIKQRVGDKAVETGADIIEQAVEVANSNRGIIAGTLALLGLWTFRNPIMAKARQLLGKD